MHLTNYHFYPYKNNLYSRPVKGLRGCEVGYSFSFNGKEKDDEVKGGGNSYDFGDRIYDSRLGRFLSTDPEMRQFAYWSVYLYAANNPIRMVDINGRGPGDAIKISDIEKAFNDGKKAASYQFTLYVDQPVYDSRIQIVPPSNVGHTFIKITKINEDGTKVERAFGFYPDDREDSKQGFAAGSPFNPNVKSIFKDNDTHEYDQSVSKIITEKEFCKIIEVANNFEQKNYCLSGSNCTDFGVAAATSINIVLPQTLKKIPFTGKGLTPSNLGQDIKENKVASQPGVTVTTGEQRKAIANDAPTYYPRTEQPEKVF